MFFSHKTHGPQVPRGWGYPFLEGFLNSVGFRYFVLYFVYTIRVLATSQTHVGTLSNKYDTHELYMCFLSNWMRGHFLGAIILDFRDYCVRKIGPARFRSQIQAKCLCIRFILEGLKT